MLLVLIILMIISKWIIINKLVLISFLSNCSKGICLIGLVCNSYRKLK